VQFRLANVFFFPYFLPPFTPAACRCNNIFFFKFFSLFSPFFLFPMPGLSGFSQNFPIGFPYPLTFVIFFCYIFLDFLLSSPPDPRNRYFGVFAFVLVPPLRKVKKSSFIFFFFFFFSSLVYWYFIIVVFSCVINKTWDFFFSFF